MTKRSAANQCSEPAQRTCAHNQVELHPYHQQKALQTYCRKEGIVLQASHLVK